MDRFDNLTDKEKERLAEIVREAIYLSEEENAAIEHQIPMTQELFEQCVDHCIQINAYFRMTCLLSEYPQFTDEYVRKIEEETADFELPKEAEVDIEESLQRFYAKVRAKYGENAI